MVADECLSPSSFLAFLANSLKLLYEIKGIACFCCSFCIFRKEFRKRVITSSSVSLGEVLINSSCPEERQYPFKMDFGYEVNQFVVYIKGG